MTHQGEVIALKGLISFSTSHFDKSGVAPRTLSENEPLKKAMHVGNPHFHACYSIPVT